MVDCGFTSTAFIRPTEQQCDKQPNVCCIVSSAINSTNTAAKWPLKVDSLPAPGGRSDPLGPRERSPDWPGAAFGYTALKCVLIRHSLARFMLKVFFVVVVFVPYSTCDVAP